MKKNKKIKYLDLIKYIVIGMIFGILFSYVLKISVINGIFLGFSLGLLFQKIVEEKKIILSLYILIGLLIGCVSIFFDFSKSNVLFFMSLGVLIGTILYLIIPNSEKKIKTRSKEKLPTYIVLSSLLFAIIGFICYKFVGLAMGICTGMIIGIIIFLRKIK